MTQEWLLQRYADNGNTSLGLLFEDTGKLEFFCDSLEDEHRDVKVAKETRIWAGRYELKIRKVESPLTLKHREAYGSWFKYHIEITGIKDFQYVYVHAGNTEKHTDACLLLGFSKNRYTIGDSIKACEAWYGKVYPHLEAGGRAFITIRDESALKLILDKESHIK